MTLGLMDVNILINDKISTLWSLHFYKPYIRNCNSFEIFNINTFSPQNYTNDLDIPFNELFPRKQFTFSKCPLNISTFSFEPFVIIRDGSNGSTLYDGVDVIIVSEISKTLSLQPTFIQRTRGMVYKNGSSTGALKMVIDGDVNMTIGIYTPSLERLTVMASTHSYMQTAFVFAFVRGSKTSLSRLLEPFQNSVWISIAALLAISITIILLTKKLSRRWRHFIIGGRINRTPILNLINVLIGNVISNPRMIKSRYFSVFSRSLTILWIFFWLIIRNSYQGSLYEALQSQRVKSPYDTVEKVRSSKAEIHIISTAIALIPDGFNNSKRLVEHDYDAITALRKLSNGDWKGLVFTNDVTINYFNLKNKFKRRVSNTRDIVRPITPVFYFNKNSILTEMFNRKIENCRESGLISHWTAPYKHKRKRDKHKKPTTLDVPHILAIIQISAFLYLIAFIIFVVEMISYKHERMRRCLEFFTY
ncbi:uncharacterized protein LOC129567447 [Sitodiplosis mosellana]|uniref:uncharacterized protein LOC129567447 n=1 Tax=Sitodiplosis mosellana TaxID=263140 RepID=UPI00244451B1|nr:uncharacterized protein LOC129567447 [Sitodiplosis mosellana]